MDAQPWHTFEMEAPQVLALSEQASAVVYRVTAERVGSAPYTALISSVYVCREGAWRLALHQQTPA
jgi:hypothetical protein